MQDILRQINSVEGVIGSAVFTDQGRVLAHVFPPLVDAAALDRGAELTLECIHSLQVYQTFDILDLRYADGRIVVKALPGGLLYLLCTRSVRFQVLTVTLNLAMKKIVELLPQPEAAPEPAKVQPDRNVLRLKISHLANKEASSSFDSLGMIAVSQPTSSYIGDFYRSAFKRLVLENPSAGTSGIFPVMVMKDIDQQFDGTIIVGPGIEKKLKVTEGDKVEVRLA